MKLLSVSIVLLNIISISFAGEVRLTTDPGLDRFPCWSPDRTKITYTSGASGNDDVWVMNADGTNKINITNNPSLDGDSEWSPYGNKIAFISNRTGTKQIWTCSQTGGDLTQITNLPYNIYQPSWSPEMSKIVHKTADLLVQASVLTEIERNSNASIPMFKCSYC